MQGTGRGVNLSAVEDKGTNKEERGIKRERDITEK